MTRPAWLRKLVLTAHVATSVGWLGAVVAFLAIAIFSRTSNDVQVLRAAFLAMELTTRYAIVPLSIASLLIGVVQSLVSPWGLLRHYWVIVKLVLTVFAVIVLQGYTKTMSAIADAAADATMSSADLRALSTSPLLHSVLALVVLLVTTILAVYKPRGMTRYGWRRCAVSPPAGTSVPSARGRMRRRSIGAQALRRPRPTREAPGAWR